MFLCKIKEKIKRPMAIDEDGKVFTSQKFRLAIGNLGVSESRSLPKGGFDLGEFPPLGDTPVVTPKAVVPAWKFLDQSLQFFPPVKKDGQVRVSPPLEAMNSSAQQLCVDVGSAEGLELLAHVGVEPDVQVDSPDIGDCIGVHYSPKEGVLGIVSTGLVASLPLGEEAASAGGFVQGVGSDKVVYCDMVLERIESAGDFAVEEGHMVMSVSSPNRFEALGAGVEVVDKQGRVSTNDVVLLMNQLKPKARGRNHQHGKGELSGLIRAKEKLLHQKLRAQFLKEGDQNTIFVFRQIAIQQKASTVRELLDAQGNKVASYERISDLFVQFFSSSLGMVDPHVKWISNDLLKKILGVEFSSESRDSLVAPITRNKIKDVVFSMNGNKAPRLDGYSENFFQVAW
ncbi:hypothetical protein V6N12_044343 [Hibiscus sabdariffa]|uniref:Uncharacterized protein n=1 Tax=Hibiscus sabdariffa TaxID=183260 RepID=A0ABR2DHY8_9ROSI